MRIEGGRGGATLVDARSDPEPGGQEAAGEATVSEGEMVVVRDEHGLCSMATYLLSSGRYKPVVGLTRLLGTDTPALRYAQIRAVVGADLRVYLIPMGYLLCRLQDMLGRRLALPASAARIWWPGLSMDSDPDEHPLVLYLAGESERDMLGELKRQFHLSHPLVHREIKLIEDLRALAEHELAQAREQNRNMKIERHAALARAEKAEQILETATPQSGETASHRDEFSTK
jgi:hypothetical protein